MSHVGSRIRKANTSVVLSRVIFEASRLDMETFYGRVAFTSRHLSVGSNTQVLQVLDPEKVNYRWNLPDYAVPNSDGFFVVPVYPALAEVASMVVLLFFMRETFFFDFFLFRYILSQLLTKGILQMIGLKLGIQVMIEPWQYLQ
jgi:hypothetical protein